MARNLQGSGGCGSIQRWPRLSGGTRIHSTPIAPTRTFRRNTSKSKLAAKGQILKATRMQMKLDCGDYYILDLSGNVMDTDIDAEELARKFCAEGRGKSEAQVEKN